MLKASSMFTFSKADTSMYYRPWFDAIYSPSSIDTFLASPLMSHLFPTTTIWHMGSAPSVVYSIHNGTFSKLVRSSTENIIRAPIADLKWAVVIALYLSWPAKSQMLSLSSLFYGFASSFLPSWIAKSFL